MGNSVKIETNTQLNSEIAYFSKANFIIDSGFKFDELYFSLFNKKKSHSNLSEI